MCSDLFLQHNVRDTQYISVKYVILIILIGNHCKINVIYQIK